MGRRKIANEEEALAAVRRNGWALKCVPKELRKELRRRLESRE